MHESFVSNLSQRIRKRYEFNFGIGECPPPNLLDAIRDYDMSRSFRRTFKQFLFVLCVYDAIFAGVIFIISYFYLMNTFPPERHKDFYVPKLRAVSTDYSPGQARGGSDDCILSTSVHRKGFVMKLSARAPSLYAQAVPKDCRIIGRFSYCFQHEEGIVNPTCCLCYAVLNLIPLFITVILLFIIYCSNSRYFAYNSSKYRLHLYMLMFCRSIPMQYIKNDEYQSR